MALDHTSSAIWMVTCHPPATASHLDPTIVRVTQAGLTAHNAPVAVRARSPTTRSARIL